MKKSGLLVVKRSVFSGLVLLSILGGIFDVQATSFQGQELPSLEIGKPIERELAGGQSHVYQLSLAAGQYLHIVTEQRGIDVVIAWFGPNGKKLIEVDSPNGTQGPEPLTWTTESSGNYRLEIRSLEKDAKTGRYEIQIVALRTATERELQEAEARRLFLESVALRSRGQYAAAIAPGARALELREKHLGNAHSEVAHAANNLGLTFLNLGNFAKAEALFQQAHDIWTSGTSPNNGAAAMALSNLAEMYRQKGDYPQAERTHLRALEIRENLSPDSVDVANSLGNLAVLYDNLGDYVRAEPLYQHALKIWEKEDGPNGENVALTLNNLGNMNRENGDYLSAEQQLRRALTIYEKRYASNPDHPNIAMLLNNFAMVYLVRREYTQAEALFKRSLHIKEKVFGLNNASTATSLHNLARVYHLMRDYAQATQLYQQALTIREKVLGPNHPNTAVSYNSLGGLYQEQGEWALAEDSLQRALRIREQSLGTSHPSVVVSLDNLASLALARGDATQAVMLLTRAGEVRERNISQTLAIGSERQKLAYLITMADQVDKTISLHLQSAPQDPAAGRLALSVILQRKGRVLDALSDSLASLRKRFNARDQAVLDQWKERNAQLARLVLNGPQRITLAEHQQRIQGLEKEVETLEAELSTRSSEFRGQSHPITFNAIQNALPQNAALIEYVTYAPFDLKTKKVGPLHYVAYTLTAQGEPRWVELGEAAPIERAITAWRQALRNRHRMDVQRLARAVDAKVMQPVRALLGEGKHLLLSPDGMLNLIPFAALVDEQGRYLVSRYECSYLTSGRDLLRLQVPRESKRDALIVANPAFGERANPAALASRKVTLPSPGAASGPPQFDFSQAYFNPLPGTAGEAQTLQRLLPQATVLTQEQATKAALQQINAPRLLHIATHGFFLRDAKTVVANSRRIRLPGESLETDQPSVPMIDPLVRSGLALAGANLHKGGIDNGILTAKEAAGLNLWGTKLVVLSACDTGIGEVKNGEGVYGLRRAFVLAGSETQVMSLWPVSDHGTRELMSDYYKGLQQGTGRSAALRQVQLRMLKNPSRRHPYYWASFIPSGEWANLNGQR
ncbi:MAG: CHAT domain-containing protein [Blastocatellia bacterium]|nr:CHAT domain-containing protein [Blastocatellia bacterium]